VTRQAAWPWFVGGAVAILVGLALWWTTFVLVPAGLGMLVVGVVLAIRRFPASGDPPGPTGDRRVADASRPEPAGRWWFGNLLRLIAYLALASGAAGLVAALVPATRVGSEAVVRFNGTASLLFVYGCILCLPGTVVWMFVLSRLPTTWTSRKRRTIALLTTPLIGGLVVGATLPLDTDPSSGRFILAFVFGVLLPAGSAFVVRLREGSPVPRVASAGPADGVR